MTAESEKNNEWPNVDQSNARNCATSNANYSRRTLLHIGIIQMFVCEWIVQDEESSSVLAHIRINGTAVNSSSSTARASAEEYGHTKYIFSGGKCCTQSTH